MDSVCAIVDAQGFVKDGEFIPRELAISDYSIDGLRCWDVETCLSFNELSDKDRKTNRYLRAYSGLTIEPFEVNFVPRDKLSIFLVQLYEKHRSEARPNFGIKNFQFGELLDKLNIPYKEIEGPSVNKLKNYYKNITQCHRHIYNTDGVCAAAKVEILKTYLKDTVLFEELYK